MKTIIAPVDFSPASINAMNYAADMACVTNCNLLLLHVHPYPVTAVDLPIPSFSSETVGDWQKERLEKLREDILFRTRERITITLREEEGNISDKIKEYCEVINPYAVVFGPETAAPAAQLLGAGITAEALQHLQWPVIIVPENVQFHNIKKIGLACDFKKVVDTIPVEEIKKMVAEFRASLLVLHVHDNGDEYTPQTIEESGWLQEMLYGLNPSYHFINSKNIEEGIEHFAAANKIDMLIVIPKKHTVLHRLFQKSHSKQLVIHSHVPVLAVHE